MWRQVIRGIAFFVIGAIALLGGSIGVVGAKGAWDERQEKQRWKAELASAGIAEVCHKGVDDECAQEGANKARSEVAYIDDSWAYLWASIGTKDYTAWEESADGLLWTQPRFTADRNERFRFARTVVVDGVRVTLWTYAIHRCGCPHMTRTPSRPTTNAVPIKSTIVRATWKHNGSVYELATFFGDHPIATLTETFRKIRYVTPAR